MAKRRGPAPLTDAIASAMAQMVDDAQSTRKPSHWDLETQIKRVGLLGGDPHAVGDQVGKRKRIQIILGWAIDNKPAAGEKLIRYLLELLRSYGGFRPDSENYVGADAIRNAQEVFKAEGFELTPDGDLLQLLLDNLSGAPLNEALERYVTRAKRGAADAALVTGTGKDLIEATAAHVLVQRFGRYPETANFPTLLGQAYVALEMCAEASQANTPQERMDAALYALACAANNLRNKEGTGHGRPFLPSVTSDEARVAIEGMGVVAERLLAMLKKHQ